jgi:hypothetical protein
MGVFALWILLSIVVNIAPDVAAALALLILVTAFLENANTVIKLGSL